MGKSDELRDDGLRSSSGSFQIADFHLPRDRRRDGYVENVRHADLQPIGLLRPCEGYECQDVPVTDPVSGVEDVALAFGIRKG
jgi:hypothetical protein